MAGHGEWVREGAIRQLLINAQKAASSEALAPYRCRRGRDCQHGGLHAVRIPGWQRA